MMDDGAPVCLLVTSGPAVTTPPPSTTHTTPFSPHPSTQTHSCALLLCSVQHTQHTHDRRGPALFQCLAWSSRPTSSTQDRTTHILSTRHGPRIALAFSTSQPFIWESLHGACGSEIGSQKLRPPCPVSGACLAVAEINYQPFTALSSPATPRLVTFNDCCQDSSRWLTRYRRRYGILLPLPLPLPRGSGRQQAEVS